MQGWLSLFSDLASSLLPARQPCVLLLVHQEDERICRIHRHCAVRTLHNHKLFVTPLRILKNLPAQSID